MPWTFTEAAANLPERQRSEDVLAARVAVRWLEDQYEGAPDATSPDSFSMRFADMTEEAEAELAEWRGILHK